MRTIKFRKIFSLLALLFILVVAFTSGALADRFFGTKKSSLTPTSLEQRILSEESVVIDVAERVSPSVVTVSIETPRRRVLDFDFFEGFRSRIEGGEPQDIGTGFIVDANGLIVTNKHVVSVENAKYKVITKDDKEYEVKQINRDPSNDVAILKIDAQGLQPVELGDSENLKVGQFVIAIGTALGEFRHTVTTGVISGLGRGIIAGSVFEGYVERLDDVIQTDAAINPGNSGGPLLNSAGQVIGINVAVAQAAENIGFAIPINVVKEGLRQFKATGSFAARAYLGVRQYTMTQRDAVLNNLPQGAYITEVLPGSPADKAGLKEDDIIIKVDGEEVKSVGGGLVEILSKKKPGDRVSLEVWRDGETLSFSATLSEFPG